MRTRRGVGRANRLSRLLRVTAAFFDRRPVRAHRQRRRRKICEFFSGINDLSTDDRKYRFETLDLFRGNGKVMGGKTSQVGQLAGSEGALFPVFCRKPTASYRVEFERFLSIYPVLFRVETEPADGLAGDKPVERKVGVVT